MQGRVSQYRRHETHCSRLTENSGARGCRASGEGASADRGPGGARRAKKSGEKREDVA